VALYLGSLLLCSVGFFLFVQARAMHRPANFAIGGGAVGLGVAVGAGFASGKWNQIKSRTDLRTQPRKLVMVLSCIGIVFLATAGLLGWRIGDARGKIFAIQEDWAHFSEVGHRISDRRNRVGDQIPAHVAMYREISPDVREFRATTSRLLSELREYDEDNPDYHPQTQKSLDSLKVAEARGELLQKEVDLAAAISALDEAQQPLRWAAEMVPLLEREQALDSREN
jgi:hypothetical protein